MGWDAFQRTRTEDYISHMENSHTTHPYVRYSVYGPVKTLIEIHEQNPSTSAENVTRPIKIQQESIPTALRISNISYLIMDDIYSLD